MKQERQLDLPAGPLTDSEEAEMELDKREALHEYQSEADPPVKVALASVFENRMPGVLSVEEVRRTIDLDQWRVEFGGDEIVRLKVVAQILFTLDCVLLTRDICRTSSFGSARMWLVLAPSKTPLSSLQRRWGHRSSGS